jgi:ligand-binding sensor domain-containing protein
VSSKLLDALRIPHTLQSRVRFSHLTTADGLSHDSVFAILQDRHGFMWFGTQGGLDRYDGYQLTHYLHDPEDPSTISSDFISILLEDSRGTIWAGRHTLSRFDPATETFTRLPLPGENSEPPALIYTMIEDRSGFLWLGMRGRRALYRLDPATGKFAEFDLGRSTPEGPGSGVFRIYQDPAGIFWLNTDTGLVRFDPSTESFTRHPQSSPDRRPVFFLRGIAEDCEGRLWKSTEGIQNFGGRHQFDRDGWGRRRCLDGHGGRCQGI